MLLQVTLVVGVVSAPILTTAVRLQTVPRWLDRPIIAPTMTGCLAAVWGGSARKSAGVRDVENMYRMSGMIQ